MHRIDAPGATQENLFTEGNPTLGIPATQVSDDWLNDVQENIAEVIEAAGIVLDKGNYAQLTSAILALIMEALDYATAAEINEGAETAKAIAPDQLALAVINKSTYRLVNLSIAATVAAKALTVALKGENGADPSATNPVIIAFRDETLTVGTPNVRTVTGALSVGLSSGSTLGFTAALAGRIYVWAIDSAGTVELALSRTADIFPEDKLVSTTAEGGAGAADSATIMYSTTARNNVVCRCIGYIDITTGAVAGEWDNAPTKIHVMGPGVKRSGDIVQSVYTSTAAMATSATTMPVDDTIPQITEGMEVLTQIITPTASINKLLIEANLTGGANVLSDTGIAFFKDDANDAIAAVAALWHNGQNESFLFHEMIAGTVSPITIKLRAGCAITTITINGVSGGRKLGGVSATNLRITEVMV